MLSDLMKSNLRMLESRIRLHALDEPEARIALRNLQDLIDELAVCEQRKGDALYVEGGRHAKR
ncbi:MAG: hypothetical protein HQL45_14150 [Alphaproteobacteria bacterium]|nr:hypothetical protein [Alphaproteobacteria bacterium]